MKFGNPNPVDLRATRNKGSSSALLPDRLAMAELTHGSAEQMALSNYSKLTPSGRNGLTMPNIFTMGDKGTKIE